MAYLTKKGKTLEGKRLETFLAFWDVFNYKSGKAEAADSWLAIPTLTDKIVGEILHAARQEAIRRPELKKRGTTPKMAQGWLTSRRWEDEMYQTQSPRKRQIKPSRLDNLRRAYKMLTQLGEDAFQSYCKQLRMPPEDIEVVLLKDKRAAILKRKGFDVVV